jgi:hypothetical protein
VLTASESHGLCVGQGAAVNKLVNFSRVQYAVIEALQPEAGSERFVIAYHSEQSLHAVIAEPCIIALGFPSREEAVATVKPWNSAVAA